jgi:hypothetical protein
MNNSNVGAATRFFLRIFSEVTYIRTVGNSTMLKIYTLPNHTITISVCILETQLSCLLYGRGASFVQKWSMPWMSANICILYRSIFYIVWFLWYCPLFLKMEHVVTVFEVLYSDERCNKCRYRRKISLQIRSFICELTYVWVVPAISYLN